MTRYGRRYPWIGDSCVHLELVPERDFVQIASRRSRPSNHKTRLSLELLAGPIEHGHYIFRVYILHHKGFDLLAGFDKCLIFAKSNAAHDFLGHRGQALLRDTDSKLLFEGAIPALSQAGHHVFSLELVSLVHLA